jgi:superfamily II DNA or RNA helicase
MSFLAQLHNQQRAEDSAANGALKIFYILTLADLNADTKSEGIIQLQLSLMVGNEISSKSTLATNGSLYFPQSQHLKLPPPFIQAIDKTILSYLLANPTYQGWPKIPTHQLREFWMQLVESNRLYFRRKPNTLPVKVVEGNQLTLPIGWQRLVEGEQALALMTQGTKSYFQMLNQFTLVATDDAGLNSTANAVTIHYCDPAIQYANELASLTNRQQHAIEKVLEATTLKLSPESINRFLATEAEEWRELGLPIPTLANIEPLAGLLRGAVICTRELHNGQTIDLLDLEFIYLTPNYCCWFNSRENLPHYVLLDNQLFIIHRDLMQEKILTARFENSGQAFDRLPSGYFSLTATCWQNYFLHEKAELEQAGFIFRISNDFKQHYIAADTWTSYLLPRENGVQQVQILIELKGSAGQFNECDNDHSINDREKINLLSLLDQIQQYNLSQNYNNSSHGNYSLVLADGRILLISAEKISKLTEEFGDLLSVGHSHLNFHSSQLARLSTLAEILPNSCQWLGDLEALNLSRKINALPSFLENLDCGIKATLRNYQWLGVCWLQHLKSCGVNGLLADDMGLGKTIQTIAHLSLEFAKQPDLAPALIVVPTSLLHNWYNEFKKFAPHLSIMIYHGPQRKLNGAASEHQIVLTSYQLIVNDLDVFERMAVSWLILDEAQNIKNPRTKIHNAINNINTQHKLCLSGTPVENNLVELWSLLNFLMPNCLGNLNTFKYYFQKPIEQFGDSDKMARLLTRIAPFMLRRTKQAVASDLPEKTEIQRLIDLSDEQYAFYDEIKNSSWSALQQQLNGVNTAEQHIFVLSALLKLRQACCDPSLLGETRIPSAKRQYCIAMTQELVEEGRSILIFSQFTSMLELLAKDLTEMGIGYGLLTGKTKHRQHWVDGFQAGDFPVFLISLKAGGVGLNLTKADSVIHYDPWWNAAAERQAADRAHRIGQTNAVFVYRLIAQNTVEEKIAALQARKAALGHYVDQQAQHTGAQFSVQLEELLALWKDEAMALTP